MAASFWTSSHYRHWLKNSNNLVLQAAVQRAVDRELFTDDEILSLKVAYVQLISMIARKTSLRQRVTATAIIYFKRFYARHSFLRYDPRLVAPVALYLAAKVEEHAVAARAVVQQMNSFYKADHSYPYTVANMYDYEFLLIAELDFDLVVFHPYRPLAQMCADTRLVPCLHVAWAIVNDSYRTDVCLHYPPYLIAIACIHMASTITEKDVRSWLKELDVDLCSLSEIIKTIISIYAPNNRPLQNAIRSPTMEVLNAKLQRHYQSRSAADASTAAAGKVAGKGRSHASMPNSVQGSQSSGAFALQSSSQAANSQSMVYTSQGSSSSQHDGSLLSSSASQDVWGSLQRLPPSRRPHIQLSQGTVRPNLKR